MPTKKSAHGAARHIGQDLLRSVNMAFFAFRMPQLSILSRTMGTLSGTKSMTTKLKILLLVPKYGFTYVMTKLGNLRKNCPLCRSLSI